jgi:hypothetical protein
MARFKVPEGLALRHWLEESVAVAHEQRTGSTHLVSAEGYAVLQAAAESACALDLREIAHTLGLESEGDSEVRSSLQSIIDGLVQSGLLSRVDDDANPVRNRPH